MLRVRGADGLAVTPVRHEALREFAFESGGLPAAVVGSVGECDLPALRHLELWLGTDGYGGDATVDDLAPILTGARLPALTHLGLRDSEIADEVAAALAGAPVVARLESLDLSLGALSDVGRGRPAGRPAADPPAQAGPAPPLPDRRDDGSGCGPSWPTPGSAST